MTANRKPNPSHREIAYQRLRERILQGAVAPGERLAEETLARNLGVSRTPVREALLQLAKQGLVSGRTNCGFAVAPLSAREIREVYPILGSLEALALRTTGILAQASVPELLRLNAALAEPGLSPIAQIEADAAWHEALLRRCPNQRLCDFIHELRPLTFRYEYAFREESGQTQRSVEQHGKIADEISRSNLDAAAIQLEQNWTSNLKWLLLRAGEPG